MMITFNDDEYELEYKKDRYNSQIVYTNNNIMELLEKVLNNQSTIIINQNKIMEKLFS